MRVGWLEKNLSFLLALLFIVPPLLRIFAWFSLFGSHFALDPRTVLSWSFRLESSEFHNGPL